MELMEEMGLKLSCRSVFCWKIGFMTLLERFEIFSLSCDSMSNCALDRFRLGFQFVSFWERLGCHFLLILIDKDRKISWLSWCKQFLSTICFLFSEQMIFHDQFRSAFQFVFFGQVMTSHDVTWRHTLHLNLACDWLRWAIIEAPNLNGKSEWKSECIFPGFFKNLCGIESHFFNCSKADNRQSFIGVRLPTEFECLTRIWGTSKSMEFLVGEKQMTVDISWQIWFTFFLFRQC